MPINDKANPNVAMTEANALEEWQNSGMAPNYRPYISKDLYGNEITEPDLSNPTRSRHERPLDTIRSFEAAAYGKEYTVGADSSSEFGGLQRGESRQSIHAAYEPRRQPVHRGSSMSYSTNQMQRNYSYGNMTAELDDSGSEMLHSPVGPSRTAPMTPRIPLGESRMNGNDQQSPYDAQRNVGYGSPQSDSGRVAFGAPVPQRLNYAAPPTPPQEKSPLSSQQPKEKKSWGKRLSFGKNKA